MFRLARIVESPRCRPAFGAAALTVLIAFARPALAQSSGGTNDDPFDHSALPALESPAERLRPRFDLILLSEFRLPGPLPEDSPRRVGESLEVSVRGGLARLDPRAERDPEIVDSAGSPPEAGAGQAPGPEPERRYASMAGRSILAERRCRAGRAWCRDWRLRVPGASPASPIAVDRRVCFGAADNRIYCVRRSNGHRVFAVDVGGRAMRPLVHVRFDPPGEPAPVDLLLAVLEPGTRIVAIDMGGGREVSRLDLADSEGYFVGQPLVWDDETIVASRQNYEQASAALVVWRLVAKDPESAARGNPISPARPPESAPP